MCKNCTHAHTTLHGVHECEHAINPNANSIMVNDDETAEKVALEKEEKAKQELITIKKQKND